MFYSDWQQQYLNGQALRYIVQIYEGALSILNYLGPLHRFAGQGGRRIARAAVVVIGTACILAAAPAQASPWAEVGDGQLRSDIQVLAAAGVIDNVTMSWPLPWAGILASLEPANALDGQPAYVREAARRVLAKADAQLRDHRINASAQMDVTNRPSVVYGYDGMGREKIEGSISAEYMSGSTSLRLSAGGQSSGFNHGHSDFKPDGSYIAQKIGGAILYAGYLSHYWGPGHFSALSLSNNARPFAHVGIMRDGTSAFKTPWLSWMGPWQAEFLVGLLDGPRIARNTAYVGARFTMNPLPGLEIGIARTTQMCGSGHSCNPFHDYFALANDNKTANNVNEQGVIDLRYTGTIGGKAFELYGQVMNEDSNPIIHSVTSHLIGGSLWFPLGGTTARLTAEYTDSVPTRDIFSFGDLVHGAAYNNSGYPDGMRYRGRTLGFSLDSDSRLTSFQASWVSQNDWTYSLSYHHAQISNPANTQLNVVTTAPVKINLGELRISMPFAWGTLDVAGRLQDDQPRPKSGFAASIETALTINF